MALSVFQKSISGVFVFSILFLLFSFGESKIPIADAVEKKSKNVSFVQKPKIQCSLKVKETKDGKKAIVSWDCANSSGWSCDLSLKNEGKKGIKKNITLPKSSTEMILGSGSHRPSQQYKCSHSYSRYSGSSCGFVSGPLEYNSAYNEYQMKCVSREGKIKKFSKGYWK